MVSVARAPVQETVAALEKIDLGAIYHHMLPSTQDFVSTRVILKIVSPTRLAGYELQTHCVGDPFLSGHRLRVGEHVQFVMPSIPRNFWNEPHSGDEIEFYGLKRIRMALP